VSTEPLKVNSSKIKSKKNKTKFLDYVERESYFN